MDIIFFDTNTLYKSKIDLKQTFQDLRDNNFTPFTSDYVVSELQAKNKRNINDLYNRVKSFKNDAMAQYCNMDIKMPNQNEAFDKSNKRVADFINELFKNNIIHSDKSKEDLDELLERNYLKCPPFRSDNNASDKGFMDTLIWSSFVKFCKNNKDVEKVYFISSDKAFTDQSDCLQKEFKEKTNKDIQIRYFQSGVSIQSLVGLSKEDKAVKDKGNQLLEKEIDSIKNAVNDFLYTVIDDSWLKANIQPCRELSNKDIQNLLNYLDTNENLYIFHDTISLKSILSEFGIDVIENYQIPHKAFSNLIEKYRALLKSHNNYIDSLIKIITDNLNENLISNDYEDLPF